MMASIDSRRASSLISFQACHITHMLKTSSNTHQGKKPHRFKLTLFCAQYPKTFSWGNYEILDFPPEIEVVGRIHEWFHWLFLSHLQILVEFD